MYSRYMKSENTGYNAVGRSTPDAPPAGPAATEPPEIKQPEATPASGRPAGDGRPAKRSSNDMLLLVLLMFLLSDGNSGENMELLIVLVLLMTGQ